MKRLVNGVERDLDIAPARIERLGDVLIVHADGGTYSAAVAFSGDVTWVSYRGRQYRIENVSSRSKAASAVESGEIRAPMPGQIVDIRVREGDKVRKGQALLVLEAMKTQQVFSAPFDGIVAKLPMFSGDQVVEGGLLALVEPDSLPITNTGE